MNNIQSEPIKILHYKLQKVDQQSNFKVECPFCEIGLFGCRRSKKTFQLLEYDTCLSCGQQVQYIDIERLRHFDETGE